MLRLDLRFTGLSIVDRNGTFVLRNYDSFKNVMDSIIGKPVLLMHPKIENTNINTLLTSNSDYKIIGFIDKIYPYDNSDEIRVEAVINDPLFTDYYNSLLDEDKEDLLSTSPGVQSIYEDEINYNGVNLSYEVVTNVDHLAIILKELSEKGFWDRFIDSTPIMDVGEKERYIIKDKLLNSETNNMAELERTSTGFVEEPKIDAVEVDSEEMAITEQEPVVEEAKVDSEEVVEEEKVEEVSDSTVFEEITGEKVEEADKALDRVNDSEEVVEEKVEELIQHEQEEGKQFEQLAEEHKDLDSEDEIVEDYTTPEDDAREVIVELVHNLVDSVEGFRKPYFKGRVKPETYIRKALSLNKEFVDSKYHSSIDSISAELGKEILNDIKDKRVDKVEKKLSNKTYVQIDSNTFIKSFI